MSTDSERQKARLRQRKLDAIKREKRIPSRAKIREHFEKQILIIFDDVIAKGDARLAKGYLSVAKRIEDAIIAEKDLEYDDRGATETDRWDPDSTKAEIARILRVKELEAVIASEAGKEG